MTLIEQFRKDFPERDIAGNHRHLPTAREGGVKMNCKPRFQISNLWTMYWWKVKIYEIKQWFRRASDGRE